MKGQRSGPWVVDASATSGALLVLLMLWAVAAPAHASAPAAESATPTRSMGTDSSTQTDESEDYFHWQTVKDLVGSVVAAAVGGWREGNGGWRGLEVGFIRGVQEIWVIFGPGGKLHPAYFLEHFHGHIMVEGVLLLIIAYLFLQSTFKPKPHREEPLTDKEITQLCKEWQPEPLVPQVPEDDKVHSRIISSYEDKYVVADGKRALNLLSHNFLNLANTPEMLAVASTTVQKYGVGSCGPRGFYGTIDVHLKLEEELAQFMGTDEAIIYSYDIATVSSIIPAFANRKDVLIIDECCGYPIQQGATLSRAAVHVCKHNDMADMERIMIMVEEEAKKEKRPLNRRIVIVEGIYASNGNLSPLDKMYELKEKYKYRLVVEESMSFGVLGENGRGAVEHWGLKPSDVEVVCGSMGNALGSVGGWCVGTTEIVEHQRLSGSGYCFSASLPPYLATSASQSLCAMSQPEGKARMAQLRKNAASMRKMLANIPDEDIKMVEHALNKAVQQVIQ
ncbi:pyridoxal phosphate-dependent transferase [Dunaliella salina]|uniref:serine C-palmitoyltransferase n=1 Tax=Dunaliella salina TaxID=3046 RepID=A0ABQ7GT05_DUNSA|nr:pyridoxal phosphate-dependent transferase [Dunaliella salina]|eukprot:KAF5837723.1 pyridoxal phosphate-dependent transferase [Dunaliella salina]